MAYVYAIGYLLMFSTPTLTSYHHPSVIPAWEEEQEKTCVDNSNTPVNIQPRLKSAFVVTSQINMALDRYLVP